MRKEDLPKSLFQFLLSCGTFRSVTKSFILMLMGVGAVVVVVATAVGCRYSYFSYSSNDVFQSLERGSKGFFTFTPCSSRVPSTQSRKPVRSECNVL